MADKWQGAKDKKAEQAMFKRMWRKCIADGGSKGECSASATTYVKKHGPIKGEGLTSTQSKKLKDKKLKKEEDYKKRVKKL